MALLAFDGFDNYSTANGADVLNRRGGNWQWNILSFIAAGNIVSPGRGGYGSLLHLVLASLTGTLTTALGTGFFGIALKINGASTTDYTLMPSISLGDSAGGLTAQVTIVLNEVSGGFDVWRGPKSSGVLIGTSPNNVFTTGAWTYIEIKATISNTLGAVEIQCNGQLAYTIGSLDTQITAHANFDTVTFFGGADSSIDDFYIADTTVGVGQIDFSTFAGDVRVATLQPIGNVGSPQWTPLTSTNWVEVSEVHNDGDASYNSTTTANNKDLFTFTALAATITAVLAVQITGSYRKDDAGTHTLEQHLSSGGTEVAGGTQFLTLAYVYYNDFWTVDPNTSAGWTLAAVNALEAGYKLLS